MSFLYVLQRDGFEVSFEKITDESGKVKATNVTAADGSPCPANERKPRRNNRKKKEGGEDEAGEAGASGDDEKPKKGGRNRRRRNGKKDSEDGDKPEYEKPKTWYDNLEESVQKSLEDRKINAKGGRAFVSVGDARYKLGTGGYAALAHAVGLLAEGTYTSSADGKISISWTHVMKHDAGSNEWNLSAVDAEAAFLPAEIDLTSGKWIFRRCIVQCFIYSIVIPNLLVSFILLNAYNNFCLS